MPRSEQANQELREKAKKRILDAARHVFARKGSNATMSDIATEAGVSQGLAYRYFPSKEAILTTLVEEDRASGDGLAARIKRVPGTPGERLAQIVSMLLRNRRERPEFYQFVHQVASDEEIGAGLRKAMQKNGDIIQEELRRLIIEGQANGEVAKDDPDQLLAALTALFDGLARGVPPLDSAGSRTHFPDDRIILRLLGADSSGARHH